MFNYEPKYEAGFRCWVPFQNRVYGLPDSHIVRLDLLILRPIGAAIVGKLSIDRINAKPKQSIELRMKRRYSAGRGTYHVPIERLKMPEVKDNPMTLDDRPFVHRRRRKHLKNAVGLCPRVG